MAADLLLLLGRFLPDQPPVALVPARALPASPPSEPRKGVVAVVSGAGDPVGQADSIRSLATWVVVFDPSVQEPDVEWLERSLKPPVLSALRAALARGPLAAFGAERLDMADLARRTADPVELLALAEATLAHRLRYRAEGDGPADWGRSLDRATGERLGHRLSGLVPAEQRAAVSALFGVAEEGHPVLRGVGLARRSERGSRTGPLARFLDRPETVAGLRAVLPEVAWSDAARAAAGGADAGNGSRFRSPPSPSPPAGVRVLPSQMSMGRVLRGAFGPDAPQAVRRALDYLDRLENHEVFDPAAGRAEVGSLLRSLRPVEDPASPCRTEARLLEQCLRIAGTLHPDDLDAQERALADLEAALGTERPGWPAALWTEATCAVAETWLRLRRDVADVDRAEAFVRSVLDAPVGGDASAHTRGWALCLLGDVAFTRGDAEEALRIWRDEVVPEFERLGDERGRAVVLDRVAGALARRGEVREAMRLEREEVLPVAERLGDERGRAVAKGKLATFHAVLGEVDEALRVHLEEEIPALERLGAARDRALAWGHVADLYRIRGDLDRALSILRTEVIPVLERLSDAFECAIAAGRVADILEERGDSYQGTRIRLEEEIPIYERFGAVRERAVARGKIADRIQKQGDLDEALRIRREEEIPVYARIGDTRNHAVAMNKVAEVMELRGSLDESVRIRREEVLPVLERVGSARDLVNARAGLALVLLGRGRTARDRREARDLLARARAVAEPMRIPEAEAIRTVQARNGWSDDPPPAPTLPP